MERHHEIRTFSGDLDGSVEVTQGRDSELERKLEFTQLKKKKLEEKKKGVEPQGLQEGAAPQGTGHGRSKMGVGQRRFKETWPKTCHIWKTMRISFFSLLRRHVKLSSVSAVITIPLKVSDAVPHAASWHNAHHSMYRTRDRSHESSSQFLQ